MEKQICLLIISKSVMRIMAALWLLNVIIFFQVGTETEMLFCSLIDQACN